MKNLNDFISNSLYIVYIYLHYKDQKAFCSFNMKVLQENKRCVLGTVNNGASNLDCSA